MVSDGNGGAFIVYQNSSALARKLYVQRLNKFGQKMFPENGILVSDSDLYQFPEPIIITDDNGGVYIIFGDWTAEENSSATVVVQRIDSTGNRLWGDRGLPISSGVNDWPVGACTDGQGGLFVLWAEPASENSINELWGQYLAKGGSKNWVERGFRFSERFSQHTVKSAINYINFADNSIVLNYIERLPSKEWNYVLEKRTTKGDTLWTSSIERIGLLKFINIDGDMVSTSMCSPYYDERWFAELWIDFFNADGPPFGEETGICLNPMVSGDLTIVHYMVNNENKVLALWEADTDGERHYDIYMQVVNKFGEAVFESSGAIISERYSRKIFSVKCIGFTHENNHLITVWSDYDYKINENKDNFEKVTDLYAQKVTFLGELCWGDGLPIALRNKRLSEYRVISDRNGGAIICWYETPPDLGVYAQQISTNGVLGEVLQTKVSDKPEITTSKFTLYQNYPNPFNTMTTIKYSLEEDNFVQLNFYNITGKEVKHFECYHLQSEEQEFIWDGKNSNGNRVASGLYFYQLKVGNTTQTRKLLLIY